MTGCRAAAASRKKSFKSISRQAATTASHLVACRLEKFRILKYVSKTQL